MVQQVTAEAGARAGLAAAEDLSWLSGGGEMGQLIRSMDWSATALGPLSRWPQSLRTSVSLCLSSTFPILVAWGPDDIQIYNDAYRPICGAKHPEAMGAPFKVCWATALPVVGDAFDRAHAGEGVYIRDQRMFLDRYGYLEEAFMTFSFSPIRVESGNVGGIFHPITESTGQVLNARRTQNLRDLTGRIARSRTIDELAGLMDSDGETLALDLPFMLLYELVDGGAGDGAQAPRPALRLRGRTGLPADSALAPAEMAADAVDGWAAGAALALADGVHVDGLAARFGRFDCAPYPEAPTGAMLLPLFVAGSDRPYGMLVAGVSARRALDDDYRNFYELLRAAFNTAIGNVLAYELEQRRAAALAEIDKAKTAFFSNVSHEFRTPLTLILGPLEDALADAGEPLAPRQRERIDVTHRNALRLLKLVNSLLDFSRIEAGRVQARYAPVDLAQLTANLASVFTAAMDKAGLAYHVDTPALAAPVYVDLDMWEKIVFNLLSNAFKFTLSGAVTVTLAAAADGRGARLTVRDTGSGIPAAELPKVFERFHRVEGVQGRSYEGTGIGLALIQVLVRLHGGSIGVDSAIGVGTAFHVEIPFGAAHLPPQYVVALPDRGDGARMGAAFVEEALRWLPDEPADAGGGGDAATATAPAAARARILVADDNQDMRGYVRLLLEREYLVETCADGEAAMEAIVRDPPDLLLSDVMMPRLDGFGLMRRIRAHPALAGLPIILLSARAGQEAKIEGLEAGADDYLVKPFSANELLARIRNHIELARERRQATIALRQREEYFRSLVNASPAMIWTTDAQGRRDFLSQRWSDYTGRSLQQDLGRGWLELIHADDAARVDEAYCAAFGKAAPFSVDYRLKDRHGAFRWMIDAGAPRFDQDGKLLGHIGTLVDVHERRLLQDRFANVTRASGIGVWYADAPLTLMQPNAQLRQQFGLPAEGPVTMAQFYLRVHHEDRARVEGDFHSAMVEGVAYDDEFRVALAAAPAAGAASARWIRMIAWCQRAEGGARDGADGVTHFDGVTLDVSDQKSGEHELRALTAELSQANQAQREFLVTLAHELRNPLAPIRSGLEMMRAHDLARDEFERVRAMMDRQVGHLVHLVDDLLDLARIARGKEVLVHSLVELEQVVRAAVEISMPLIDAGGHRLLVSAPSNAPPVWLDAHRVAQVIGNLLNNAAKYTPNGGTIELMAVVEAGELTVTVRDNGIGIPADALPTVFDMFTQVPGSEGQAQGGLGIGLNLVRRLVELHGGEVSAHSGGAGQGSAFTLRLPVTPSVAAEALARSAPAPALPAAAAPRVDEASASSLRVLVVDDNVDAAETLTALLEFKGHTVAAAHDGPAALAAALSLSPQVVFLDIGLPGMSGYEVARALRAMPALDGVALIALTGWGTDADRLKTDAAGFDHHLTKPVSFDEILRMLTALERQQKA